MGALLNYNEFLFQTSSGIPIVPLHIQVNESMTGDITCQDSDADAVLVFLCENETAESLTLSPRSPCIRDLNGATCSYVFPGEGRYVFFCVRVNSDERDIFKYLDVNVTQSECNIKLCSICTLYSIE